MNVNYAKFSDSYKDLRKNSRELVSKKAHKAQLCLTFFLTIHDMLMFKTKCQTKLLDKDL